MDRQSEQITSCQKYGIKVTFLKRPELSPGIGHLTRINKRKWQVHIECDESDDR